MKRYHIPIRIFIFILCLLCILSFGLLNSCANKEFQTIPIKKSINNVQPMTGIVLWEQLDNKDTDAIQLEYSYMRYNDVVKEKGVYDWTIVEQK